MKKKIKDLTLGEMGEICVRYTKKGEGCLNECAKNIKCPLWYATSCLQGFIQKLQYIEREVEVDD